MKRIKKTFFLTLFVTLISVTLIPNTGLSDNLFNGFNVSKSLIPQEEIIKGGPPRDGIPAILYPKFEEGEKVRWLRENDIITGIDFNGTQKAYPFKILVWHEAVNDEIDEIPILVSYCPLCGSTIVFRRDFWKKTLTFGISGLLYQSNVLFYDHQTESLWSQLEMKAVTGEMIGARHQIAALEHNVALVYMRLGRSEEAKASLARALSLAEELRDIDRRTAVLIDLVEHLRVTGEMASVMERLNEVLEAAEQSRQPAMRGRAYLRAAAIYHSLGEPQLAESFFKEALRIFEQNGFMQERAEAHFQYGQYLYEQGRYVDSAEQYRQAYLLRVGPSSRQAVLWAPPPAGSTIISM